ncbi:MAG: aconitate hydratase AcnA [Desulfobacteraceae bacterium]|nr:aconitate hydratase AcnA [Desulfobacteraceae bacterium]
MQTFKDSFKTLTRLSGAPGDNLYFDIHRLESAGFKNISTLPFSIKILLENLLRHENGETITENHIRQMADWQNSRSEKTEIPLMPSRILLQDFTGVPAVADIAAMRSAAKRLYGDPMRVNLLIPSELVIDHSVQVDHYGSREALDLNVEKEFQRNHERYAFLRWAHGSIENFAVVPPGAGICHQVNLEYLARGVFTKPVDGGTLVFPDSLVGLDSHTTMINGIGVLGWGVGGIEAEAVMLGRPYYFTTPEVVGFKLTRALAENVTATDLVLVITQMLREKGVVGKFVEFFGPGLGSLHLEDRATIANMAPEYGATMGFFPVDDVTLNYLRFTGRAKEQIALIEQYFKAQGLYRTPETPDPDYSEIMTLDMATVLPCLAGPSRPQDRILLSNMAETFLETTKDACEIGHHFLDEDEPETFWEDEGGSLTPGPETAPEDCVTPEKTFGVTVLLENHKPFKLYHGSILIAAITSCTNTSNPHVMIQAGLLAKKAVEKGLKVKPWVKTSLAPGSKAVRDYLVDSGLMPYLEELGFHLVAFGCTTCIGNSGPLAKPIAAAVTEHNLVAASVLSGNRNFPGRISPLTQSNYLASPPLVVAYALAGSVGFNLNEDHLGHDEKGQPVYLKDLWPSREEVAQTLAACVTPDLYQKAYQDVFEGSALWKTLDTPRGAMFQWTDSSTYIKEPPFLEDITREIPDLKDIHGARVLALFGDSVTTDHISPAGAIPEDSPAAQYLKSLGVKTADFNSYGSRRGNHEVMMRGTFGNIRLNNRLVPDIAGGWTRYLPEDLQMPLYDAAMKYRANETPLIVLAGKYYGSGSSRDWAAKGTLLLGIKAVLAESFERIHRSNLVCMGVLPLEFMPGESAQSLGLDGTEVFDVEGIGKDLAPGKVLKVRAMKTDGSLKEFQVIARLDGPIEVTYYRNGGILPYVLRSL